MTQGAAVSALLAAWAIVIAAFDVRWRRVPNWLLLGAAVPALVIQLVTSQGMHDLGTVDAFSGSAIGFALTWGGYLIRQVGAGDVKYAAVLGFLTGMSAILNILLWAALVIGLLSLAALMQAKWNRTAVRKVPAALALSAAFVMYLARG